MFACEQLSFNFFPGCDIVDDGHQCFLAVEKNNAHSRFNIDGSASARAVLPLSAHRHVQPVNIFQMLIDIFPGIDHEVINRQTMHFVQVVIEHPGKCSIGIQNAPGRGIGHINSLGSILNDRLKSLLPFP